MISLEAWDQVWRRNQYLATALLERDPGLRMLFVEPDQDPLHDLTRRRLPRRGAGLARLGPVESAHAARVWRWSATKALPRRMDRGYDARWARRVQRAAARLGFDRPLLWVNDPRGAAVLQQTGWPALYDITDDWLAAHRSPAQHARIVADEAYLLQHAGAVVACSPALAASRDTERELTVVTNAADVERFSTPAPRPRDLPARSALYVGTLHEDRLDVSLLVQTAKDLAGDGQVVLLGPDALSVPARRALLAAGAVFLGARPHTAVPGYLQHADLVLVPHIVDSFTESLDPVKLYEYLAVGATIVSTPVAGFRDRPEVRVAGRVEFPGVVRRMLTTGERVEYAVPDLPTWQGQGEKFALALDTAAGAG